MQGYTHVIWDWNGTLLDDVSWCVNVINKMLSKRGLPSLDGVDAYHRVFGFPVIEYYQRVGFDLEREPFDRLAIEYMALYHGGDSHMRLFPGVEDTLRSIRDAGIRQVILSASEQGNLLGQLVPFNIGQYFDEIIGISDIYANSKLEAGRALLRRVSVGKAVLIGDTTHDSEVAAALGVDCVLVASGHQSMGALRRNGVPVISGLSELSFTR